jgi:16S rRNA (uracil1498-N3)-methyltransferase
MRNFFCNVAGNTRADRIDLDSAEKRHATKVLRLRAGEPVQVLDGSGTVYRGTWDPQSGCVCVTEYVRTAPFRCQVTLAVALLKGARWDWFLEKAVEIGVSRIVPLLACHGVARPAERDFEERRRRWRQIAISALKQSGQVFLPAIESPLTVEDCCAAAPAGARWILSERGGTPLRDLLTRDLAETTVMIGPEGGWSDEELERTRSCGFKHVTLGPHILRAETVPLYVLSVIRFVTE